VPGGVTLCGTWTEPYAVARRQLLRRIRLVGKLTTTRVNVYAALVCPSVATHFTMDCDFYVTAKLFAVRISRYGLPHFT
jgi:hypothetical protein